jgi:molybdopterin synthase sulfur carrier subunit
MLLSYRDACRASSLLRSYSATLEAVFRAQPQVRGYVLDEQGELRKHVFIFVDGRRAALADAVNGESAIHVLQALTGG